MTAEQPAPTPQPLGASELSQLKNVTALEAFCLATAVVSYLSAVDPQGADIITAISEQLYNTIMGAANGTN